MKKQKTIKVLSLFDGISVAQQALKELGYKLDYFASEIDKYAIEITQKNHPETIQLGSVLNVLGDNKAEKPQYIFTNENNNLKSYHTGGVDLLIGGSPCQDLSIAKTNRQGLNGNRSSLFYEYLRVLKETKPKYFILENVASMSDSDRDTISKELGVEPIMIDASLVSGQQRKRYFWTNIQGIEQPKDRGVFLKDVIEPNGLDITERMKAKKLGTLAYKKAWGGVRKLHQKSKALTAAGQQISNSGATNIDMGNGTYRAISVLEAERLQSLPDNYTNIETISRSRKHHAIGNAFNKEVIKHILSYAKF